MRARGLLDEREEQQAVAAAPAPPTPDPESNTPCFQLNGDNLLINDILPKALRYPLPDIQVQIKKPRGLCEPCNVSYAVSAALGPNEYVGVGFKGQSWEGETPDHPV